MRHYVHHVYNISFKRGFGTLNRKVRNTSGAFINKIFTLGLERSELGYVDRKRAENILPHSLYHHIFNRCNQVLMNLY